jgi:cell shape-determining protein MreC
LYAISTPFVAIRDAVGSEFSYVGASFNTKENLIAQNAELEKDISAVNVKLLSMEALESQNQALENLVAAKQTLPSAKNLVFAEVVERPPFSPYDSFVISSGSNSGITVGNPVFDEDGTPIGTIQNVFPSSAKVLLFSSSGNVLNVTIGTGKSEVQADGKGGGNFIIKIPMTDAPKDGDAVYIPQFSPVALGVVQDISAQPTDTFANVLFSLPENIFEMSFVTVDTASHFQINQNSNEATTTGQ